VTAKPLSSIAAAADAIAVPPMPVKWTDLISDENIAGKFNRQDATAQSFSTTNGKKCETTHIFRFETEIATSIGEHLKPHWIEWVVGGACPDFRVPSAL
jgi:hypothetical protein